MHCRRSHFVIGLQQGAPQPRNFRGRSPIFRLLAGCRRIARLNIIKCHAIHTPDASLQVFYKAKYSNVDIYGYSTEEYEHMKGSVLTYYYLTG
jgi:hypothetical protein